MNGGGGHRGSFLYPSNQTPMSFHLQSTTDHHNQCFQSPTHVKTEANNNNTHHHLSHHQKSRYSLQGTSDQSSSSNEVEVIKAKIVAHPQYSNLLEAYMDCQKVTISFRPVSTLHESPFIFFPCSSGTEIYPRSVSRNHFLRFFKWVPFYSCPQMSLQATRPAYKRC